MQDSAEQATNIVVIESNPAEMEEKASLDLGRRFVRPCRCRIMISRKISETKSGIDYKHKIYIHACISIRAVELVFKNLGFRFLKTQKSQKSNVKFFIFIV